MPATPGPARTGRRALLGMLAAAPLLAGPGVRARAEGRAAPGPVRAGEYRRVHDPSLGEDRPWYINDHCFVRGRDGLWHLFGITHPEPADPMDERIFAHATAPHPLGPWTKHAPALTADPDYFGETVLWAPHVVEHAGLYWMFYCGGGADRTRFAISAAVSADLWRWRRLPTGPLFRDGYLRATIAFWVASFMGLLLVYGLNTWLPEIMRAAGYELGASLSLLLVLNVGAVLGLLLAAASLAAGRPRLAATAALGCVLCGGVYLLVRLVLGDALGPGDVKLAGALGAAVGGVSLQAVAGMVVVSAVLTALLARLLRRRDQGRDARDRSEQVPAEQARAEQPGEQQPQGAPERQGRPEMARGVPHGPALLGPAWLLTALGP